MATSRVDSGLISRAIAALKVHDEREHAKKRQLIDRASSVLVTITLKADNQGNTAIYQQVQRPVRVPLPNSIYNEEEDSTCLFVKTEDAAKVREMVEEGTLHVAEVFSMTQVRKELNQFAERKKVLSNHTHFFCDDRITPHLYNSLGKVFLGKNKHPVPIRFGSLEALPATLRKAQASSFMHLKGVNISFKAGFTDTNEPQLVENISQGLENAVNKINGKWGSIQTVHIKTPDSFAIPIFSSTQNETLDLFKQMYREEKKSASREERKAETPAGSKRRKQDAKAAEEDDETSTSKATPSKRLKAQQKQTPQAPREEAEQEQPASRPATPKSAKKDKPATPAAKSAKKTPKQQKQQEEEADEKKEEAVVSTPTKAGAKRGKQQQQEDEIKEEVEAIPSTPARAKRTRAASVAVAEVPATPSTRTRAAAAAAAASAKKSTEPEAPSAKKRKVASAKKARADA